MLDATAGAAPASPATAVAGGKAAPSPGVVRPASAKAETPVAEPATFAQWLGSSQLAGPEPKDGKAPAAMPTTVIADADAEAATATVTDTADNPVLPAWWLSLLPSPVETLPVAEATSPSALPTSALQPANSKLAKPAAAQAQPLDGEVASAAELPTLQEPLAASVVRSMPAGSAIDAAESTLAQASELDSSWPAVKPVAEQANAQPLPWLGLVTNATAQQGVVALPPQLAMPLALTQPDGAQQLGERLQWMLGDDLQEVQLQLHPRELGHVSVQIRVEGQAVQLSFLAEHPAARAALEQALPQLRERFSADGLQLQQAAVGDGRPQDQSQSRGAQTGHASSHHEAMAELAEDPLVPHLNRKLQIGLIDQYV